MKIAPAAGYFFGVGNNRKVGNVADLLTFARNAGLPKNGGTCVAATTGPGGCLAPGRVLQKSTGKFFNVGVRCYGFRAHLRFWQDKGLYLINSAPSIEPELLGRSLEGAVWKSGRRPGDWTLLRLHSIGDFSDVPYINAWYEVLRVRPWVEGFGYTRSWRLPTLLPALDRLRELPNVQIFASMDDAIFNDGELWPERWRPAWMGKPPAALEDAFIFCPENRMPDDPRWIPSCRQCGFCWLANTQRTRTGVWFASHF